MITVSCMGHSGDYFPGGAKRQTMAFQSGESIAELLERLRVSTDLFMYAIVNGEREDLSYRPKDGDDILLVSPLMGG